MDKINYIVAGDKSKYLVLEYGSGKIKACDDYVYLGAKINTDRTHDVEINERINKGRTAISKLNGVLWDRNISSKTKIKNFNTIIRITIRYAVKIENMLIDWTILNQQFFCRLSKRLTAMKYRPLNF